jgi:histone H3/H4
MLKEASESYLVSLFNNSSLVAYAADRVTIQVKDMRVAEKIMLKPYEKVSAKYVVEIDK